MQGGYWYWENCKLDPTTAARSDTTGTGGRGMGSFSLLKSLSSTPYWKCLTSCKWERRNIICSPQQQQQRLRIEVERQWLNNEYTWLGLIDLASLAYFPPFPESSFTLWSSLFCFLKMAKLRWRVNFQEPSIWEYLHASDPGFFDLNTIAVWG